MHVRRVVGSGAPGRRAGDERLALPEEGANDTEPTYLQPAPAPVKAEKLRGAGSEPAEVKPSKSKPAKVAEKAPEAETEKPEGTEAKVVSIDAFRKKT